MLVNSLAEIASVLKASRSLLVSTHIQLDGDAIGSLLALGLALESSGRQVVMYCEGGVPQRLRFLVGADKVVSILPKKEVFRLHSCPGLRRQAAAARSR